MLDSLFYDGLSPGEASLLNDVFSADALQFELIRPPSLPALRPNVPHEGGTAVTDPPEVALTALTVEALLPASGVAVRGAIAPGPGFLLRHQLIDDTLYASLEPKMCHGAFPLSPILSLARADVTACAIRALDGDS